MSEPRVAYTKPPSMSVHSVQHCLGFSCGYDTVKHDGEQYVCSDCGTCWADEYSKGQLYPEWSGDHSTATPIDPDKTPPRPKGHV